MLRYAAISLAIAVIALVSVFLAPMLAAGAAWVAKIILFVAILAFIGFFILHMMNRKKP